MKRLIRWPTICTRCGSLNHYVEDCKLPNSGMCDIERRVRAEERRQLNCGLGIVATLVLGYFLLAWIGGTGL